MKRLIALGIFALLLATSALAQSPWVAVTAIDTAGMVYKSVDCLPSGVVWLAGGTTPFSNNYGYVSTDFGSTWRQFLLPNTSAGSSGSTGISNVSALNADTALIGLNTGEVIRTTNGGTKWDTVYSYVGGWVDGVKYLSSTVAVAYGDADASGVMIARSTDGGATFTRAAGLPGTLPPWGYYTYGGAMDAYNNTVWCTLYDASNVDPAIAKSTDAGVTWNQVTCTLPGGAAYDYQIHGISFKDDSIGYAVCRGLSSSQVEYVIKTTNGGTTWSDTIAVQNIWPHNLAQPVNVHAIRGTNTVLATGKSGSSPYSPRVWRSTDAGATWATYILSGWRGYVMNADNFSATSGMAIGSYFAYKFDFSTGVEDLPATPTGFVLEQNYPNPFNPSTTIRYAIKTESQVTLQVYDMLGRIVSTLVNEQQASGTYNVVFNASGLSSGVYFYTLRAGSFSETKRLLLTK